MSSYADLLRTPGVARIIAAQLTARMPNGMLSLAYLLHIEHITGSYGAAGLVLAATSAGQAIAGPLTSRWMGVWGMRRVLTLTLIVCGLSMAGIAFLLVPVWAYMLIGLIGGLATPPVQPAVRTIYPKMVNSTQLTPLFSLDAAAQELIWVLAPVITTLIGTQVSTVAAIVVAGAFLIGGGIWFIASPEVGRVRIPRSRRSFGVVLKQRPVLLSTITGFLLIGSCAAVEAGTVAAFGEEGSQAGIVLGLFAVGSFTGGLAFGHLPIGRWAMATRMLGVALGMGLTVISLQFWWLAGALFVAGIGIAPALAVMFAIVSASVKFSSTAEAYGWIGTGQLIGAALGSAAAGFMIDGSGPRGAFVVAFAFAVVGVLVPAVFVSWHPDLRGRDASPIPDTEPVGTNPG